MAARIGHLPKTLAGLRVVPWLQAAHRDNPASMRLLMDCQQCEQLNTSTERQAMACGWEPPVSHGVAWCGDMPGERPTICAGYLSRLPEVIEVTRLRCHWKAGQLAIACHERPPTPHLLDAVLALDWEISAVESHALEKARKGK